MPIRYSSVVGGSSSTGFNLDVGSSGNTTFYFNSPQPAGGYSITSQLADSSIEFYAIAEDGTLAGYTNTKALSATKDFDTLVVYGATTNDLITFEYKSTTLPTASGDQDSGAAPFITSVSDADLANIDDTTIITGGNFATDVVVTFTGTDAVVRNAKSVVRTNSTQLIVTRPDDFLEDNSPYTLTVSNPGITQSAIITNTSPITAGGDPVWATSAGALEAAYESTSYSQTIVSTDPDSGAIDYFVSSGSLPPGLSLGSSTGSIFGIPTTPGNYTFEVSATDQGGNETVRQFSINVFALISATGGSVEDISGYRVHTFNSSGTFTVLSGAGQLDYLVVAGGGAGGFDVGGGGGAGGLLSGSTNITPGSYTVTVGAGGNKNTTMGGRGGDGSGSSFSNIIQATGGGGGGNYGSSGGGNGGNGGSGGGAAGYALPSSPGSGIPGQGNDGGPNNLSGDSTLSGSGGGGAGGPGAASAYFSGRNGAVDGGPGLSNSISGSSIVYSAGGKGAADSWMTGQYQPDGDANSGNGGNGDGQSPNNSGGANGGSGIVIIRYPAA